MATRPFNRSLPIIPFLMCAAMSALLLGIPAPVRAQFTAPLPRKLPAAKDSTHDNVGRRFRSNDIAAADSSKGARTEAPKDSSGNEVPNLLMPVVATGFANDRGYVTTTAFTGHAHFGGLGFNIDVNGAKVVSTTDEPDPTKRKTIKDTKSLVTLLVENSGDIGMRLYSCPDGCLPRTGGNGNGVTHKFLTGISAGSYSSPDTADKDPKLAFGPIAQYYLSFDLTDGKSSKLIGALFFGGRAGVMSLTGGSIPGVSDSRYIRYISETVSLIANNAVLFGVTLTQTQGALKAFVPGVQLTTSVNLK